MVVVHYQFCDFAASLAFSIRRFERYSGSGLSMRPLPPGSITPLLIDRLGAMDTVPGRHVSSGTCARHARASLKGHLTGCIRRAARCIVFQFVTRRRHVTGALNGSGSGACDART